MFLLSDLINSIELHNKDGYICVYLQQIWIMFLLTDLINSIELHNKDGYICVYLQQIWISSEAPACMRRGRPVAAEVAHIAARCNESAPSGSRLLGTARPSCSEEMKPSP